MKITTTKQALLAAILGMHTIPGAVLAETLHNIDVLGVYPDHVADLVADPAALFVSHIEYANRALQNSNANYRYTLAAVLKQNWANDSGIGSAQLESAKNDENIKTLREQYGADLVAGMVPQSNGYCGIGYVSTANSNKILPSWAKNYGYSLSGHNCGGRTMAHEIGHNMGLGHSPAQGSKGGLADWARGWGVNGSFVTIMAYNSAYGVYNSAGRLQIHSNPALSVCNGQACGQPIDQSDGADAVRAMNLASSQIAQWLAGVSTVPQNNPPNAVNDTASTDAGVNVAINALQNDSDPDNDALTIASVTSPANGQASIQSGGTRIVYLPDSGFTGNDSFSYTIGDGRQGTATAAVTVQVNAAAPPSGDDDSVLVVNGGAELGTDGWLGIWGTAIALSNDAHSGNHGIRASGGRGVFVDLQTPIAGNRDFNATGWIKANTANSVYIYAYLRQNGRWRYQYLTGIALQPGQWQQFDATRYIDGLEISDGYVLFYAPNRFPSETLIDGVALTPK